MKKKKLAAMVGSSSFSGYIKDSSKVSKIHLNLVMLLANLVIWELFKTAIAYFELGCSPSIEEGIALCRSLRLARSLEVRSPLTSESFKLVLRERLFSLHRVVVGYRVHLNASFLPSCEQTVHEHVFLLPLLIVCQINFAICIPP